MRAFAVGSGRVQTLAYAPDDGVVVADLRDEPQRHPSGMGFTVRPASELVWWDVLSGAATRRFRLRDSLYGPGGAQMDYEGEVFRQDRRPNEPALDVAICLGPPLLVATVWEWTNKEDGVCLFDVDSRRTLGLWAPYKTHAERVVVAPDGSKVLAATSNDNDPHRQFEVWPTAPEAPLSPTSSSGRPLDGFELMIRKRFLDHCNAGYNDLHGLADLAFDGRFVAALDARQPVLLTWDSQRQPRLLEPPLTPDGELDWSVMPQEGEKVGIGFAARSLAFAPGGSLLAVAGEGLALFDAATRIWRSFDRCQGLMRTAVAFTADGREVVCGTAGGHVEHWEVASGRLLRSFDWGRGTVSAVATARDGSTCAAGTESGWVVVWDREAN